MGEIAESMIEGESCSICTTYLGRAVGYPRYCRSCKTADMAIYRSVPHGKIRCSVCMREVKLAGLADHMKAKHT